MKKHFIFATANSHKLQEVHKVLNHDMYTVESLKDVGITDDIPETGDTLEENALIKARYVADKMSANVFSEDSGLEVDALDGAPGVITARYAGSQKDAKDNMQLLLNNLKGASDREAQFRAIIALIIDGQEVLFEGVVRGRIATAISGVEGFGYDPIFIPDGYDSTFADLPSEVKLSMSHRSKALKKMMNFLENR